VGWETPTTTLDSIKSFC
jgi:hypothetical protein